MTEGTAVQSNNANRPSTQLVQSLAQRASLEASLGGAKDIAMNAIDGIMEAATVDDVFAANEAGPVALKDSPVLGQPFSIASFDVFKSDGEYEDSGLGSYIVMRGYTDNGDEHTISTGASNVVASVVQLERLGLISDDTPVRVRFVQRGRVLKMVRP